MGRGVENKAKGYYEKVLTSHKSQRRFGDDDYEVYAQCLFDVLYGKETLSEEMQLRNSVFHGLLLEWVNDKKPFDFNDFKSDMQKRYSTRKKRAAYNFVFGIHIKPSVDTFPFKRQFKIDDINFKIISYQMAKRLSDGNLITELSDLYQQKRYEKKWIEGTLKRAYIFIQATVNSIDSIVAANKMTSAFGLLTASATVAQERNSRTYHTSGVIKSKKPILDPYVIYWIDTNNPYEATLVTLGADMQVPDAGINFTESPQKVKSFRRYLSIIDQVKLPPIEKRIKDVILEFDRALGITEPNLRMLSMWKCLEIASRLENGSTRKYSEIIEIIRNYHDNDVVNEKARLVLEARNEYVHQGITIDFEKRDNYLRWVQDFVSAYLGLLMWMRSKKIGIGSAGEIDALFDFYRQSDEELALAGRLLYARQKDKKKYAAILKKQSAGKNND